MSHILFEQLENAGYLKDGDIVLDRVRAASWSEIVELATESAEITSAGEVERDTSAFSHSASLSLGGGRAPCVDIGCRSARVKELSQFAALYSDRVYIHNFLSDIASHAETENVEGALLDRRRASFYNDLQTLLNFRPLIEAGRVVPVTAPYNWCPHCFRARLHASPGFSAETERGLASAGHYLRTRFLSETKITLERAGQLYFADIRGPSDLLEHGFRSIEYFELPEEFRQMPEILSLLARGRKAPLSRKQAEKSRLHEEETALILENVMFELAVSQIFGTSFLTERPIHVEILRTLSSDSKQERRNEIIRKHLTTLVPFIDGADPAELLRLREQEDDSFILFRQALNRAVDEASRESSDFNERHARELYGDVLEPSLARLDVKMKSAQRALVGSSRRKISAWVGAISFGLFSGFVPSTFAAAAKVLGLTKVAADLGESALNARRSDTAIRSEDFYFLWRVRKMARKL